MTQGKKILIMEDSDLVAGMLSQFFESEGYTVFLAENGALGIEQVYAKIPDLIIMDVEMPLIQGYQASRLLKSRRGVSRIPIIMHTSRSEDKDRYWALDSGVDAFITKDFDNLEKLLEKVKELIQGPAPDAGIIAEDGRSVNRETVFEMVGNFLDGQLFRATVVNMLGAVGKRISSVSETVDGVFDVLSRVCEYHICTILLRSHKTPMAYIRPGAQIYRADAEDFLRVCMNDFNADLPDMDLERTRRIFSGIETRKDFEEMRMDARRVSSYACFPILGKGDVTVGTLHVGHLANNYYSGLVAENISVFTRHAGPILENTLLFNRVTEMENRIRTVFSKFVPGEVIEELMDRDAEDTYLRGEKRTVAVLFSDIRDFTTISENNSAEEVVSFLNRYFDIMVRIIRKHGGTIDKFIGDAILAIFGAPISYEDNASRAVKAATEIIHALGSVDPGILLLPEAGLEMGIGIHEGVAVVGNIGSADKFDYTVIGDTVNLASRLEGLTKHYRKTIIVSETVKDRVEDDYLLREADTVKVKGKDTATGIYAVEMDRERFDTDFMNAYGKALKLYKMGNWNTALEYFSACREKIPEDPLTEIFMDRCRRFLENPPENWDGTISLDFK